MHEWGDSGITAVLLAIGVAVLLSLVLAQQARTRAARYKEIRRLQSVAAEEARREEEEAHTEYNSMVARGNYCAVCFNPTSTRCSRCKAVRYCSSTCQVKHWKDGHKQECRAPNPIPSPESSSNGSRSFSEVFSSNGSAGSGGSGTLSEISEVHTEEGDATRVALARRDDTPEANGNGSLLKPKKVLFPYEYFVKFFNWERLKVPPCGLLNCGNSCFANVVLQCLTYTRPLTAYLLEGTHGEECRRSEWCFMCELQDHVWRVRQSQNPFSPIRILSRIRNIGNHLGYGRQEDAHEFMRFAIDSMQSICLDEAGGEKAVDPRSQETTFIHYIFGGHLQSQVKCMQCLHESNRYENMMDLAVEIHGCVETLEDALTQFTAPEWLDGENKYKCDRCNAYVKARKRLTLHEAPNILTIALKRFQSGKFGKLNKRVTFPEVLDVSPYMSGKGDMPPLYRLYAVVVHVDMLNASFFGHYICYVKDSQGLWYKIDDSKVKEVDLEKVMAQRAYMLFYSRSSARPQPLLDGAVSIPYPVAEAVEMERISSDRHGGVKVFPSSNYPGSEEVLESGGSRGLHVMVDFNELLDNYVEYNSETVTEQEMLSNGEVATIHPSSWETERLRSSTPNNGEIETEDIACIASSSSLTETSPYISSFTSNQGLWIPTQGFVQCQVPGSGSVEGTEFAAWDPKSSLHDDFSEVSLQPCAAEMPCNNSKIGKRRLEDGLSPLPTPKPLDTDQLPAWPAGSQGRSNSCLPTVQHVSSPSPTICSIPGELHPPLQKYEPVIPAEASQSGAFPLQQRVSSNLVFLPPLGESNVEPEMADYSEMETTGLEMEEISVRPKRQHVETDAVTDLVVRIERPDDIMLQTVEDSSSSDMGGSEMDWDAPIQHPGSLTSGAIWGPLPDPNGADSSADTMTKSASHGQEAALNYQPAALQSSVSLESGGLERSNESKAVEGNELEESSQGTDLAMESAEAPPELVGSLPHGGWQEEVLEAAACRPELTRQDEPLQSVDQDVTLHDGDTTPAKQPLSSTETHTTTVESENDPVPHSNGPALQLSDTPGNGGKSKSKPKPLFAPGFLNKARSPAGAKVKSSSNTSGKPVAAVENGHVKQVEEEGGASENVAANDQKCPANGDSNTSGKPAAAVENGHVKQVEEEGGASENVAANDQKCSSNGDSRAEENVAANDQKCSSNGESQAKDVDELRPTEGTPLATLNDDTSTIAANGEVPSCGDCMNCDTCNSAHSDSKLENGHQKDQQVSGTTPDSNDNHIVKNRSKNDPGVASSSKTRPNSGVNGNGPSSHNSRRVNNNDEKPGAEPVTDAGTAVSSRPAANGKQKQGRNETCNCGSQRKWKKCCGQTGLIKAERQTRRLLV